MHTGINPLTQHMKYCTPPLSFPSPAPRLGLPARDPGAKQLSPKIQHKLYLHPHQPHAAGIDRSNTEKVCRCNLKNTAHYRPFCF